MLNTRRNNLKAIHGRMAEQIMVHPHGGISCSHQKEQVIADIDIYVGADTPGGKAEDSAEPISRSSHSWRYWGFRTSCEFGGDTLQPVS